MFFSNEFANYNVLVCKVRFSRSLGFLPKSLLYTRVDDG